MITSNKPSDCAVCFINGGVGNIIRNIERAIKETKNIGLKVCFLYWGHRTPLIGNKTLDDLFNLQRLSSCGIQLLAIDDAFVNQFEVNNGGESVLPSRRGFLKVVESEKLISKIPKPNEQCYSQDFWGDVRLSILIAPIADAFTHKHITSSTLGVHVRRTDFARLGRPLSTNQMFFESIDKVLPQYDKIFLATDDHREERRFQRRYGDRIVFTNKSENVRWSGPGRRPGMITWSTYNEALVDMLILGNCKEIFGSQGSTFSSCSALLSLNHSKLTIIK